jgi:hypothetical protein
LIPRKTIFQKTKLAFPKFLGNMKGATQASAIDTVVALNNRGVDCFNQDTEGASKYFREALGILRNVLATINITNKRTTASKSSISNIPCPLNPSNPSNRSETRQNSHRTTSHAVSPVGETGANAQDVPLQFSSFAPVVVSAESARGFDDSGLLMSSLYIYAKPLKLECSNDLSRRRIKQRANLATLAVSFNLGLAHQLMSLVEPSAQKARRYMRAAVAFYEVSHVLHRKFCQPEDGCFQARLSSTSIAFLELSILNNVALLHDVLGNRSQARSCFQKLVVYINDIDASAKIGLTGLISNIDMIGPHLLQTLPAPAA